MKRGFFSGSKASSSSGDGSRSFQNLSFRQAFAKNPFRDLASRLPVLGSMGPGDSLMMGLSQQWDPLWIWPLTLSYPLSQIQITTLPPQNDQLQSGSFTAVRLFGPDVSDESTSGYVVLWEISIVER